MPTYLPTLNWPIYSGWTNFTPTIPKMYWDVYSQEQRIKWLCMQYSKCEQYLDYLAQLTNDWANDYTDEIQALLDELEKLLTEGYEKAIDEWFEKEFYRKLVKQVYFGLTLDGHFVAYIPDSWEDIVFDTGYNYTEDTYGRLILRWAVDGSEVDQRPESNQYGIIGG